MLENNTKLEILDQLFICSDKAERRPRLDALTAERNALLKDVVLDKEPI